MSTEFFGRTTELESLDALWAKHDASLVACRGRRRIGKSTLIEEFARRSGARFICIDGLAPRKGMTNDVQLRNFTAKLAAQTGLPEVRVDSWLKAFMLLDRALPRGGRTVVLFDEVSWMGGYDPDFSGQLKSAWDLSFKKHRTLVLVVCGSVSAWVAHNLLENTGFAGRFSRDLVLGELPLPDCVKFWGARASRVAPREIVDVLSVTGGVPRYLEEVDPALSADENIRRLCFRKDGTLFQDFHAIFNDVFGERSQLKRSILSRLAEGARTSEELAAALRVERGGSLSETLRTLELAGFVASDGGLNPLTGRPARQARWRLRDNYTRFYLRYIAPREEEILNRGIAVSTLGALPGWSAVLGLQFENLVLNNISALLPCLRLEGVPVLSAAPWRQSGRTKGAGVQIDLLLQTRRSVHVVEIKRRAEIGAGIEQEVERKVRLLKVRAGVSVRTALVYEGELAPSVIADRYLDALVPASSLLGLPAVASRS